MKASDFDTLFDEGEDVSAYLDMSKGRRLAEIATSNSSAEKTASAHKFLIRKNKSGEYVAYFTYNSESIFWTEGYSTKAAAQRAIEAFRKFGPSAEIVKSGS